MDLIQPAEISGKIMTLIEIISNQQFVQNNFSVIKQERG